jgi:hypothetical protein
MAAMADLPRAAADSLRGLALGDGFGERWFFRDNNAAVAMIRARQVLGDVDTTCAITGGVVAARTGLAAVPARWLELAEPLPGWAAAG